MNSTALSTKGLKLAVGALLAAAAFMALAFSATSAKASTPGADIQPEFNYVGLFVGTTVAGNVDNLVLEPDSKDGNGDPLPPLKINGKYTDANGNFTVPKNGGLVFPPLAVDLDLLVIDGKIGLTEDGVGHYDEATGAMSLDLKLALELGVDDLEALSNEVGIPLGTGELACEFAPLSISAGTDKGWPHPGKVFADKANLENGAIAGAWRSKPAARATEGDQSVCNIIGGFLKPVGGIWLANSSETITDMPDATTPEPSPETCEEHGQEGTFPDCVDPVCPEGQVGTPPDCNDPPKPVCKVGQVKVSKAKVKAGKRAKVRVTVKNNGTAACKGKVALKSNKKFAKVAKNIQFNVKPGKSQTKAVVVRTTRKAKGKVRITATFMKKKGNGVVTVQKAKQKKKRR